jgi:protein-tyrosine-phosphatase/DNA-binding transcriptional ArsR family regulator
MKTAEAVDVLAALAQDARLEVVRQLVRAGPDGLAAGEIARKARVRPPTLSFHLARLEEAGVVASRREGRSIRYALRSERLAALFDYLGDDCCQGRRAMLGSRASRRRTSHPAGPRPAVLFLCSGNSARSQMAQALLRARAGDRFDAMSAGFRPMPVNPLAREVLAEIGVDASGLRSTDFGSVLGKVGIDHAIVVCDQAQRDCAGIVPFARARLFWPIDDPAAARGPKRERRAAFRRARDELEERIERWLQDEVCESA